jgi:cation diffusion facilitator CzcD-associated flavoprotein CzcO
MAASTRSGTIASTGRVCVIGSGIAGLVTARVLRDDGFDVTVFDRSAELGGVWASSRTYPGLRANNSRYSYSYSDFPYPADADEFPTAEQVRAYLHAYSRRFEVAPLIRSSTEVVSVASARAHDETGSGFDVAVRPTADGGLSGSYRFDFVAVCNGTFCDPHLPDIPGREKFAGRVLHSSQFTDGDLVRGRRVVVVGAGKSALDCATFAAREAASCTLLYRAPHWMVPRHFPGGKRADEMLISRFSEMLLPPYHRPSRAAARLHRRGGPLVRLWWRVQNYLMRRLLKMPPELTPDTPLPSGFENIGVGNEFYVALEGGRIHLQRGRIAAFAGADSVALDSGKQLDADVVVFATGWRQGVPFLEDDLRQRVLRDGTFHLYRHILPPTEPRLGFIGYSSSVAAQLTSEISAHWLSQCFRGELALPSVSEMDREIARVHAWMRERFPARPEGYFVGPYIAHYLDELLTDMGLHTNRTGTTVKEFMGPLWPPRYRDVGAERRASRGGELAAVPR